MKCQSRWLGTLGPIYLLVTQTGHTNCQCGHSDALKPMEIKACRGAKIWLTPPGSTKTSSKSSLVHCNLGATTRAYFRVTLKMPLTDAKIRKAKPIDKPQRLFDGGGLYESIEELEMWTMKQTSRVSTDVVPKVNRFRVVMGLAALGLLVSCIQPPQTAQQEGLQQDLSLIHI